MTLEASLGAVISVYGDGYRKKLPKKGATYPAITYMIINENEEPMQDRSGVADLETLYQVTIWAETASAASAIARTMKATYNGFVGDFEGTEVSNVLITVVDEGEDVDEQLHSLALEFRIFQT